MAEIDVDTRRLVVEIIATLAHVKNTMVELILKPAGVPQDVYRPLLYRRNEATGRILSKREIAPLILGEIEQRPDCTAIVRRIIEIAAHWTRFDLANDEYEARATVQKARDQLGIIKVMEAQESKRQEAAHLEEFARVERERAVSRLKELDLLTKMFDELARSEDEQRRGYLLQDLLNRVFNAYDIPVVRSFTRNEGGEQIDGAFRLEGWHYIVECRWRRKLSDIRELDGLSGQIARSGRQTMGVFLSMNGWSDNVIPLLRQNPDKSIILMNGYDLRTVLSAQIDLRSFLSAKVARLNLYCEPYYSIADYMQKPV